MIKPTLTLAERIGRNDPSAHCRVVSAIKRAFSRSPTVVGFLAKNRREEEWVKKDGSKARRPKVFYTCNHCKQEFRSNQVQVDHIDPVIPLNIPSQHLSYNTLIARTFCDESNLQILCKEHHAGKSAAENAIRDSWLEKVKFIVYETTNHANGKRYIGVHKCLDYDDVYFGSGKLLKAAIKKYGIDSFSRHIMFVYDNAAEAFAKEHELVNEDIISSEQYYNLAIGGSGNVTGNYTDNKVKVICHETGEIFDSVGDAACSIGLSSSSVSVVLNDPNQTVRGYHYFKLADYDEEVKVTYPSPGRPVVYLNTRTSFSSLKEAADALSLNYKSLRNAIRDPDSYGVCSLNDDYFVYLDDYSPEREFFITKQRVKLVQKNLLFESGAKAGEYIKHKKPTLAGIAICKAARTGSKMYGFNWEIVTEKIKL